MRIVFSRNCRTTLGTCNAGDVHEVSDQLASMLIGAGVARLPEPPKKAKKTRKAKVKKQ